MLASNDVFKRKNNYETYIYFIVLCTAIGSNKL